MATQIPLVSWHLMLISLKHFVWHLRPKDVPVLSRCMNLAKWFMKNVAHFGFKSSKMEGFFAFLWCATSQSPSYRRGKSHQRASPRAGRGAELENYHKNKYQLSNNVFRFGLKYLPHFLSYHLLPKPLVHLCALEKH